jgi:hypothetical protein
MALGFWQKSFASRYFREITVSASVLWNPRGSTLVVETLWRRNGPPSQGLRLPDGPPTLCSQHEFESPRDLTASGRHLDGGRAARKLIHAPLGK